MSKFVSVNIFWFLGSKLTLYLFVGFNLLHGIIAVLTEALNILKTFINI